MTLLVLATFLYVHIERTFFREVVSISALLQFCIVRVFKSDDVFRFQIFTTADAFACTMCLVCQSP